MPRKKLPYKATLNSVMASTWVSPVKPGTETPTRRSSATIPALDARMPDGREVYVTFERPYTADTPKSVYIARMRALAGGLLARADQLEADGSVWAAQES